MFFVPGGTIFTVTLFFRSQIKNMTFYFSYYLYQHFKFEIIKSSFATKSQKRQIPQN